MRRVFFAALIGLTAVAFTRATLLARPSSGPAPRFRSTLGIDGIVVRGRLRARLAVGRSLLQIDGDTANEIGMSRDGTTLAFVRTSHGGVDVPTVVVRVARLRGVATSGDVDLVVDDRSDRPLFLDLAGSGRAIVRGIVPLARTTTSGTVRADFSALRARTIRVHARERSRAIFDGYEHLTIVAVDDATIDYRGPKPERVTIRNRATVRSCSTMSCGDTKLSSSGDDRRQRSCVKAPREIYAIRNSLLDRRFEPVVTATSNAFRCEWPTPSAFTKAIAMNRDGRAWLADSVRNSGSMSRDGAPASRRARLGS